MEKFDLVVIGGGPGGYVAAIRAAQLGMKVALVEKEHLGGICLNWGCIPTKALLKVSEVYHSMQHADSFGISVQKVGFDLKKVVQYSRDISKKLASGVAGLMRKNKITVVEGFASFASSSKLVVKLNTGGEQTLEAKNFIIATGARPRELPTLKADGKLVWNYKHAMVPDAMPKKLLVVGSGAIGIEFASFYNYMGADVTVCELAPKILPNEDHEVSAYAKTCFEKRGMEFMLGAEVTKVEGKGGKALVSIRGGDGKVQVKEFDKVISAVGVVANIENLGLEKTKVQTEKGTIAVNEYLQTAEKHIYAIGDVVKGPWLAHKASHEGIIAVEHIKGLHVKPMNVANIPACTYCSPQIASIGLTEERAKAQGHKLRVGKFPLQANGKAIAISETDGFAKMIFDEKTGELLGAHLIGAEVTEMLQGISIAKYLECTEEELAHVIFPHPTISESIHEATLSALGRVIHT